jgi:hypothetical protein
VVEATDAAFFARTGDVPAFLALVTRLVDRPTATD